MRGSWLRGLRKSRAFRLILKKVETNIVIFDVRGTGKTAAEISGALAKRKVLANPTEKFAIRMVTHYDVERGACERALKIVGEVV